MRTRLVLIADGTNSDVRRYGSHHTNARRLNTAKHASATLVFVYRNAVKSTRMRCLDGANPLPPPHAYVLFVRRKLAYNCITLCPRDLMVLSGAAETRQLTVPIIFTVV
jgi:2-polyprenyl-6-methoxyphenol hydroxylase-like FAD-dependent oxidoreductase